mgnify:CR=1 FL=1
MNACERRGNLRFGVRGTVSEMWKGQNKVYIIRCGFELKPFLLKGDLCFLFIG